MFGKRVRGNMSELVELVGSSLTFATGKTESAESVWWPYEDCSPDGTQNAICALEDYSDISFTQDKTTMENCCQTVF